MEAKPTEPTNPTFDGKKGLVLEVWIKKGGVISEICKAVGINRSTYYDWVKNDLDFLEAVKEKNEELIDFAEAKLMQKLDEGNLTAIIFFLKTKGKSRGFIESHEFSGPGGGGIPVKMYDFDPGKLPKPQ
ncbi:MAG: hypothetical protein JXA50_01735 [Deltaproteobacteria bacterium]|nr:hypothetical protein [Deltaproteobacteria bacterium]